MTTTFKRPAHLTIGSDFALYDMRKQPKFGQPLRPRFQWTFKNIATGAELRSTIRGGEFTFPGGYPLYFITSDGGALSFDTVRKNLRSVIWSIRNQCDDGWRVVACDINYEDAELTDDHTGEQIESAYAEA